jgi:uncharacterized damage-inducible protein DinB
MSPDKMLDYNVWANKLVCSNIETFSNDLFDKSVGGSFGSLKATIVHLFESDWLWLNRWKGIPLADVPKWDYDDAASINKLWYPIQDEMLAVAKEIKPEQAIHFITRKGASHTLSFEDIVMHVTNHGSYHRGQLTHIVRELGQKPVSTDYFIFCVK